MPEGSSALECRVVLLVGYQVVVDEGLDLLVGRLVGGPLGRVDVLVLDILEHGAGNHRTFGDKLCLVEVGDTVALVVLHQNHELVDEELAEGCSLLDEILLCFYQLLFGSILTSLAGFLGNAGEQSLSDDCTGEGRGGLQGGVLDIAGLVSEDGPQELLLR